MQKQLPEPHETKLASVLIRPSPIYNINTYLINGNLRDLGGPLMDLRGGPRSRFKRFTFVNESFDELSKGRDGSLPVLGTFRQPNTLVITDGKAN